MECVITESFEPNGGSWHLVCGVSVIADNHYDFPKRLYPPGEEGAALIKAEILTIIERETAKFEFEQGKTQNAIVAPKRVVPLSEITTSRAGAVEKT
jgi:hypothetical protein